MFIEDYFYTEQTGTKAKGKLPREEFVELDNDLFVNSKSVAYCINCKTPYIRVCPDDDKKRMSKGIGWTISTVSEYAISKKEKRDEDYPIIAKGYCAFLLSKVETSRGRFYFKFSSSELEEQYFQLLLDGDPLPFTNEEKEDVKKQERKMLNNEIMDSRYITNQSLRNLIIDYRERFVGEQPLPTIPEIESFFHDRDAYCSFMREIKNVSTSKGYRIAAENADPQVFKHHGSMKSFYDLLIKYKDNFPLLGSLDSFRKR